MIEFEPWAIDYMQEGEKSLFWEGTYAGIGWIVFESDYQILEFLERQVCDQVLGDKRNWGETWSQLKQLRQELPSQNVELTEEIFDFAVEWLKRLDVLLIGSSIAAKHFLCGYEEIMKLAFLRDSLLLDIDELPTVNGKTTDLSNEALEMMIQERFGEPSLWF